MHDVDVVTEGGRYQFVKEQGMRITNITTADDGEYTCRAEVDSDGRYDERKINVSVHSKSTSSPSERRVCVRFQIGCWHDTVVCPSLCDEIYSG